MTYTRRWVQPRPTQPKAGGFGGGAAPIIPVHFVDGGNSIITEAGQILTDEDGNPLKFETTDVPLPGFIPIDPGVMFNQIPGGRNDSPP